MVEPNEIVTLILGTACLSFIRLRKRLINQIPCASLLLFSYYSLYAGWLLTVVEDLVWGELLNLLEHLCYVACSVFVAVWCWKVSGKDRGVV